MKKVFFVPSYIGSLKYYERIARRLGDRHDVGYVIIQPYAKKRDDMIAYCKKENLLYYDLTDSLDKTVGMRLPFYTPLRKRYLHGSACRTFLMREKPLKVIATKSTFPHDTILKEANLLGIETIMLRWAFYGMHFSADWEKNISQGGKRFFSFSRVAEKIYNWTLRALARLLDFSRREPLYGLTPAVPQKVGTLTGKEAELLMRSRGISRKAFHVLEHIDVQSAYELKQKVESDTAYKKTLLKKYNLSDKKTKIFLILYRLYADRGENFVGMSAEEHIAHYYSILKTIRDVFSPEEADIFLKLHPSEKNVYDSYKELGVRIFGDESNIEELVCLSDLYIASPMTNVNYLVLGSSVPALFTNLFHTRGLDVYAENFHIRRVITDKNDFFEKLKRFKNGNLEKQYDNSGVELRSLDRTIEFIKA